MPATVARPNTLEAGFGCLFVCHSEETLYQVASVKEYRTGFSSAKLDWSFLKGSLSVSAGGHPQVHPAN